MPASSGSKSTTKASAKAAQDAPENYDAALRELEELVSQLDAGQLPLEELLGRYRRGAELLNFCRGRLEAVEQQIKVLEGDSLQPWEDD
ncbi:exodeoxyribonuclease VII small subunit [Hydrogenophaga sp. 5NK40-0174]|uniref:exodeoxyribonuclease VII small subunit n=1 Tax=Hydrogenophaga sp. 5NK40-0174 TaxID=3127649 RepID=UPI003102C286